MAVEDAVIIAECLSAASEAQDVPPLLRLYERLRKERAKIITKGARANVDIWHLPDGPEQELRDLTLASTDDSVDKGARMGPQAYPNSWNDPIFQPWLFGFDALADVGTSKMRRHGFYSNLTG